MFFLTVEDHFSSAHQLRGYKGKCENLHGHNWKVLLTVKGEILNEIGLLIDFHDLRKMLKETLALIDHCNINETVHFKSTNPSSEELAKFIYLQMESQLEKEKTVSVKTVTVFESEKCSCSYEK